jgi:high-affinity nickel-transport protein
MLASLAAATDGSVLTLLSVLALGFFLGMRHATDADHVVAVTTIVSRERTTLGDMLVGALWGIGHTLTILVVGGAIVMFGIVIPPRLGMSMEMSVAAMLIVLGLANVTGALRQIDRAAHAALHQGDVHAGDARSGDTHAGQAPHAGHALRLESERRLWGVAVPGLRPLIVGVVHGLAGSAAVALLVLATIRDVWTALLYLLVFGGGTVAGMMLLTTAMAYPVVLASRRFGSLDRVLARVTGVASIAFGLFMIYEIGFVDGLFTTPK